MREPPLTPTAWLRYDVVRHLLDSLPTVESVLEIGAGQGAFAFRLARRYEYTGLEPDAASFDVARARLRRLGRGELRLGYSSTLEESRRFDLVCAFEVLEHIEDDRQALRDWRRFLTYGGWLLVSVPAGKTLGPADRRVGHVRRYRPESIEAVVREAGFVSVSVRRYGFPLGYLLEVGRNLIAMAARQPPQGEATSSSGRWLQPPDVLGWATKSIAAPSCIIQRPFIHTRLGTGLVVLARADD